MRNLIPITEEEARIVMETLTIMQENLNFTVEEAAEIMLRAEEKDFDA